MDSPGLAALGFWIFIAAIMVAGMWSDSRKKAEKHETLRRIVEKTGTIDEAKLKELFAEPACVRQKPGGGYRALRIAGSIVMFIGAGIFAFFSLVAGLFVLQGEPLPDIENIAPLFAAGIGIAFVGFGLFFSSRFAEPPADRQNEPPAP
jgi:hypothetical protein